MTRLLALLLLAGAALAQNQPNPGHDLNGWSTITWGMSIAAARAVVAGATLEPTQTPGPNFDFIERFVVPDVKVATLTARASIESARGADQISAVTLRFGDIDELPANRAGVFADLKRLLIEKYGSPKDELTQSNGPGSSRDTIVLWTFPLTSITLTRGESPRGYGYVSIHYQAVDKKSLDTL